jgi:hypothetical protein
MEPLLIILIPGLFGGLLLAVLIRGNRHRISSTVVPRRLAPPSPSLINMAHIHVEGIGGLGMVAAVVVVAVSDPRIRLTIILASVLGAGLALFLIAMRRPTGALPSGGDGPDDRSTLHLDAERRRTYLAATRAAVDQRRASYGARHPETRTGSQKRVMTGIPSVS